MAKLLDFRSVVIVGNVVFILCIIYNGIDEGFKDIGSVQSMALLFLIALLLANSYFLFQGRI
jgi:hypothetical protein